MSAAGLLIDVVRDEPGLSALASRWDALVHAMPRPSPYLLHGWVEEWWRHVGRGGWRLAVPVASRGDRLVGVLPIAVARRHGLRSAAFLGGNESALADVLVAEGEDASVAEGLVAALCDEPLDLVAVTGLPAQSRFALAAGDRVQVLERVEAPVLDMPDGWEAAYVAHTSSKRRNQDRRRERQLAELGIVEFEVAWEPDEVDAVLDDAFRLHAARWHGRPDRSSFGRLDGQRFQRAAFRRVAADGGLCFVVCRLDGQAVAFHSFFALGGAAYLHRNAVDPALLRYSPGLVTMRRALAVASEHGLTRVEYLGAGEQFKLDLADRLEPMHDAIGLAHGLRGSVATRATVAGIEARKRLKRSAFLRRLYHDVPARLRRRRHPVPE
jgi:CelD/BcsL family acetyltransferase involved in cellulose biosynthesis